MFKRLGLLSPNLERAELAKRTARRRNGIENFWQQFARIMRESRMHRADLVEELLSCLRGTSPQFVQHLERDLQRLLSRIHENPFDPTLNVKELKKRCRISDNNISMRFRSKVGMTIHHYIEELRLSAACQLLKRQDLPIFDIALSVGYGSPQSFYQAFRRSFGSTPANYRSCQFAALKEAKS